MEFVNFVILDFGFFPQYFLYDLSIVAVIAMIAFILPHYTAQYIASTIMLGVHAVLIYANYSLYNIYTGDLLSFDLFTLLKEAGAAMTTSFVYFSIVFQIVLVFLFIAIVGFLILKFCLKDKYSLKNQFSIATVFTFLGVQLLSLSVCGAYRAKLKPSSYNNNMQDYVFSDSFYMHTDIIKENSFKKYGTYGFYLNMIFNTNHNQNKAVKRAALDYFNKGATYSSSDVFGVDRGNNVIVIMMESLEWFAFENGNYNYPVSEFSDELTPNIYSLIAGSNSEPNTPEDKRAIVANHFFAKSKTNISEGYGIIGNYPVGQNLYSLIQNEPDEAFGYTLPNILKQQGYVTNYVHSNTLSFYDRDKTHKHLGFDNLVGKESILDEDGKQKYEDLAFYHWINEETFVSEAMDGIVPKQANEVEFGDDKQKFFTYYLNVSSHGNYYDNANNQDQLKYKNYIKYGKNCVLDEDGYYILDPLLEDTPASELYTEWYSNVLKNYGSLEDDKYVANDLTNQIVNYMCGAKGLDAAIGVIIKQLKDYQILDDTTLVLYADHYAYYDSLSNKIKSISLTESDRSVELTTIPFILSSPGLKNMNTVPYVSHGQGYDYIDKFCSAYDIIPTVLDLLGIPFNTRLYLGNSLFNPERTTYKALVGDHEEVHTMNVYYSNIGGLYCQDVFTSNLKDYIAQNKISQQTLLEFINRVTDKVVNVFYLDILNNNNLFPLLT